MGVWKTTGVPEADFVLVDGRFRVACVLSTLVWGTAKPIVAIHDFRDRERYQTILDFFEVEASADTLAVLRSKRRSTRSSS
jgi:hypothetical protein